ncbi:hypothetical protein HY970_02050 [Candidatus Kaiserbacteria bacterium]|nr:hypothetical protein [Candidatus Kaiserbacteria bacterium]
MAETAPVIHSAEELDDDFDLPESSELNIDEDPYESLPPVYDAPDLPSEAIDRSELSDQQLSEIGGVPSDWTPEFNSFGEFKFEDGRIFNIFTGEEWVNSDPESQEAMIQQFNESGVSTFRIPDHVERIEDTEKTYVGFIFRDAEGNVGYQIFSNERTISQSEYFAGEEDYSEMPATFSAWNESIAEIADLDHGEANVTPMETANAVLASTPESAVETTEESSQEIRDASPAKAEVVSSAIAPAREVEATAQVNALPTLEAQVREILKADPLSVPVESQTFEREVARTHAESVETSTPEPFVSGRPTETTNGIPPETKLDTHMSELSKEGGAEPEVEKEVLVTIPETEPALAEQSEIQPAHDAEKASSETAQKIYEQGVTELVRELASQQPDAPVAPIVREPEIAPIRMVQEPDTKSAPIHAPIVRTENIPMIRTEGKASAEVHAKRDGKVPLVAEHPEITAESRAIDRTEKVEKPVLVFRAEPVAGEPVTRILERSEQLLQPDRVGKEIVRGIVIPLRPKDVPEYHSPESFSRIPSVQSSNVSTAKNTQTTKLSRDGITMLKAA